MLYQEFTLHFLSLMEERYEWMAKGFVSLGYIQLISCYQQPGSPRRRLESQDPIHVAIHE